MLPIEEIRSDKMGELHNQIVVILDGCEVSPPDAIVTLRMIANDLEKVFEASVKSEN
jgi:hypothetical protein